MKKTKIACGTKMSFAVVTALAFTLAACDSEPEYPSGATHEQKAQVLRMHKIKQSARDIVEVDEELMGQRLVVKYQPKSVDYAAAWVRGYLTSAFAVMKEIQDAAPDNKYREIVFDVQMPTVDRLGKADYAQEMLVTYDWDEIKHTKWENMTSWDIANLADHVSFGRLGLNWAVKYCMEDSSLKHARDFCLSVAAEAQKQ